MDWGLAIRRNRDQLRQIVLALFAMARMRPGGYLVTLPRHVAHAIMHVLRPAESAVRRLIVIAAHGLVLKQRVSRPGPVRSVTASAMAPMCAFPLFDPLKSFDRDAIWDLEPAALQRIFTGPAFGDQGIHPADLPVKATAIGLRLNAILAALDDIPRQARRLARWRLRRDEARKLRRPVRFSPMRPGLPPGWRDRKRHEIDFVLRECHILALDRQNSPNTS